ncbi:MAG: FecR family protein [Cyanobacteria bacterium P01_H01_bin.121]
MTHLSFPYLRPSLLLVAGFWALGVMACRPATESSPSLQTDNPASGQTELQAAETPPATTDLEHTEAPGLEQSATAIASVSEIEAEPVWVRPQATEEVAAVVEMPLDSGDVIRTEGEALAEVEFANGLGFRIGGDAALEIQPSNVLALESGEMITWVEPGQKIPVTITTPGGVAAGIRGTTVFVRLPADPGGETLFFAWEGTVGLQVPDSTDEVILNQGEEVSIPQGERDLAVIRQRVRRLPLREWQQRRRQSRLLNRFQRPLPTLDIIDGSVENLDG